MSKSSTRLTALICNIIIAALCVLAIAAYFFLPLWKADISYTFTAETMENVMQDSSTESESETEEIDFKEIMGEDGISLSLSFSLKTQDVLAALTSDATETVATILDENAEGVAEQLLPSLQNMMKSVVKKLLNVGLEESVRAQVSNAYGGTKTEEEITGILNDAGIDEEYIASQTNELFDSLFAENATVDSVSTKAVVTVETALEKLATVDPNFENLELTEESKAEIKDSFRSTLSEFAEADGSIDVENMTARLLLQALSEEGEELPESDKPVEDVKLKLKETFLESIDTEVASVIVEAFAYASYVLIFTFFTWAYILLKIVIKLGATNNTVKLKLPIWLGNLPFLVLYLLPTLLAIFLKNPPAAIAESVGAESIQILSGLELSFFSAAIVPFIISIVFILFSIFFYGGIRRKLKKYKRGEISDDE